MFLVWSEYACFVHTVFGLDILCMVDSVDWLESIDTKTQLGLYLYVQRPFLCYMVQMLSGSYANTRK